MSAMPWLATLVRAHWIPRLLIRLFIGYFFFETGWAKFLGLVFTGPGWISLDHLLWCRLKR
jgi:uncharacterized membrane protein YphA (DoxX/SURF4 family)